MTRVEVHVEKDHLERLARKSPLHALAELIWNGLDADATDVNVHVREGALGGVEEIAVTDNGHGMTNAEATEVFGLLGGSWKRRTRRTRSGDRILHGKDGEGRFRVYALGTEVEWVTTAQVNSGFETTTIRARAATPTVFDVSDPAPSPGPAGTVATILQPADKLGTLLSSSAVPTLVSLMALYLEMYSQVNVIYRGWPLDPERLKVHSATYTLDAPAGTDQDNPPTLRVIEWASEFERRLYLCDASGMALAELPAGIQAPGFFFTAYIPWVGFENYPAEDLELVELAPTLAGVLDAGRDELRRHFRRRAADRARLMVEEWKRDAIYPFEGDAAGPIESAERDVFDVVAVQVASYSPRFAETDNTTKRLSFRLLREGIEQNPSAVHKILGEVLGLPLAKQDELAQLLDRTSLSAIIGAAKKIADRLDFLRGLETLLFDKESKAELLERTQLHRILASETWIFGEEYALMVDDESLTEVLAKHLALLGRDQADQTAVRRPDGRIGIIDMMLSKASQQMQHREHLVVELKRPSVVLGATELNQIESYALAVAGDERFRDTDTMWEFWLVSNEMNDTARYRASQQNRPLGLASISHDGRTRIWVKTWGQVLYDCRARLQFVQANLAYAQSTREQALEYLRTTHSKYLPPSLATDDPQAPAPD